MENETILYVVHQTVGGFAREDSERSHVVGVFTDASTANKVKLVSHGEITEIKLNHIPAGFLNMIKEFGFA
jgi:hypothetical protein